MARHDERRSRQGPKREARSVVREKDPRADEQRPEIVRGERLSPAPAEAASETHDAPELALIIPTLNERDNVIELLERLQAALTGIRWEVIFVDDDSRDGTQEVLRELARSWPNVRCLVRIGRRGLSSACIEGMLATAAPVLAVMDADLQHDETLLPLMLQKIRRDDLDVVVASRFAAGGSVGEVTSGRLAISRLAAWLSRLVLRADLSDPMSGFFIISRNFFEDTVRRLSGQGFKILLDLFVSAPREVRFAELPYRFRQRRHGESKLDAPIMLEYLTLLADKLIGRWVPIRFVIFVLVGLFGMLVHLATLAFAFKGAGMTFYYAQAIATLVAMTVNFNLNNELTYRDRRLRGAELLRGHLSFYLICSIGAVANFQIAEMLYQLHVPWPLAGLLGAVVSSVWNYGVSSTFTWRSST
jgi:dolichol-phosphate mannosyltransferase